MKNLFSLLTAMIAVFVNTQTAQATVYRVNNNSAYNQFTGSTTVFSSLTSAIGSSSVLSGDTLYVEASATSYGVVTLNKSLTIIGTGYFLNLNSGLQNNQIASTLSSISFAAGSSGSTIAGLRFADVALPSVNLTNVALSNITITRCYIQYAIGFQSVTPTTFNNIVITKNYVGGVNQTANPGIVTGLMVTNNYFSTNVKFGANQSGIIAQNVFAGGADIQAGIDFFNNIFTGGTLVQNNNASVNMYDNLFSIAQPVWLTGGSNDFGVPSTTIFPVTGTLDGRFDPNPIGICPQCYQGFPSNSAEVGMFGGNDPYILSGIPTIPAIYNLQAPPNAYPGNTVTTNISTRSNH